MADSRLTQPSFTGGELSRHLYGRKDFARYQVGVKYASNMIIHATGGMSNRSGLRLVGEVKNHAKPGKLMTFEAAGDDAFLLVWGDLNVRPVAFGSYINDGGVPYEVVTPYAAEDLPDLYMEQSNDIATITHPDFVPRELARYSALDWRVTSVTFTPELASPTGVTATTTQGYTGYDESHLPVGYDYKVSAINAAGEESLPSAAAHTSADLVFGYEKNFVTVAWTAVAGAQSYQVYKADNGVYGSIGNTPNLNFKDKYISPDFTSGPQQGYNPFASAGDYPSIVFFSQQRRGFAHTNNRPQTVWMTQSGNFKNMNKRSPSRDDDAIEFTLAAQKKQDIFHVLSVERGLIVFTRSGEWRVTGNDGTIITPSSILPEPQSQNGSSKYIKPMVIGEAMLFVGRDNRTVYEMEYSFEVDRYKAKDMNLMAKHLFEDRQIIAWAHASDPDGIIWCVMSDGTALSLTYLKEHDVWGWTRHDTRGSFLDVSVVPDKERDVPYFLVRRRVQGGYKVFVEMLEARIDGDMRNSFFVDCGLSYDMPVAIAQTDLGDDTRIRVPAHGLADGDEIEIDQSRYIDQQDNVAGSLDGKYLVQVDDADWLTLFRAQSSDEGDVGSAIDSSAFIGEYEELGVMRKCVSSISGLGHLNGREVVVLADGFVLDRMPDGSNIVVTGGALPALEEKYARIHVGLPYRSAMATLDFVNPQLNDNGMEKVPGPIYVNFLNSRGAKVGFSMESAVELHSRGDENMYDPSTPQNGYFQIEEGTDWGNAVEVWVVQDYPLPVTVLGMTTDMNYGGNGG